MFVCARKRGGGCPPRRGGRLPRRPARVTYPSPAEAGSRVTSPSGHVPIGSRRGSHPLHTHPRPGRGSASPGDAMPVTSLSRYQSRPWREMGEERWGGGLSPGREGGGWGWVGVAGEGGGWGWSSASPGDGRDATSPGSHVRDSSNFTSVKRWRGHWSEGVGGGMAPRELRTPLPPSPSLLPSPPPPSPPLTPPLPPSPSPPRSLAPSPSPPRPLAPSLAPPPPL